MSCVAQPLSSHRVLRTTSVDAARAAVSATLAPHRLVPVGTGQGFRAVHNRADLDGVKLHFIDYTAAVDVEVEGMNFQLVQVPLAGRTTVDAGGEAFVAAPGSAGIVPVGRPLRMRYSAGNPRILVEIPAPLLQERVAAAVDAGATWPRCPPTTLDLTRGAGRAWRAMVDLLLSDLGMSDGLIHHPTATASLTVAMVDALVAGMTADQALHDSPGETQVHRAARLMEAHCAEPLGTPDVAEAVNLSVRALQAGFRAHLGTTPMAYLRRVRLARVRESLSDGSAASVTEAAVRWGVPHLGRLAADYRAAYGEGPGETLRRSR